MTKGIWFPDLFKVRAYMECFTNSRDNTQCCQDAGITGGEETDPEKKGCLAMRDGTRDIPGRVRQRKSVFVCSLRSFTPFLNLFLHF